MQMPITVSSVKYQDGASTCRKRIRSGMVPIASPTDSRLRLKRAILIRRVGLIICHYDLADRALAMKLRGTRVRGTLPLNQLRTSSSSPIPCMKLYNALSSALPRMS